MQGTALAFKPRSHIPLFSWHFQQGPNRRYSSSNNWTSMYTSRIFLLLSCSFSVSMSIVRTAELDLNPPSTGEAGAQMNQASCPSPINNGTKPFWFVPATASPEAQQFLSTTSPRSVLGEGPMDMLNMSTVAALRQFFQEYSAASKAAEQALLQSTHNDTIAGVPVVFAQPITVTASDSSRGSKARDQLLIYLHGGGYVFGSCWQQWSTVAPTAAASGLTVLCIEYRLAPEHPFPAALNDVVSVYKELLQQGYAAHNLVILGDSAGAGLAAALAIQLQRERLPLPAALGMFSPWAELGMQLDTMATLVGVDPLLAGYAEATACTIAYVGGNKTLYADPLVSPLRADFATIFAGSTLPRTMIQAGLRELLLSDAVLLYHKMNAAANRPGQVLLSAFDAMWHVFQSQDLPEARAAHQQMADFFLHALHPNTGQLAACKGDIAGQQQPVDTDVGVHPSSVTA